MTCKICGADNNKIFEAKIINRHHIVYYYCSNCGFLQTEEPYWSQEALQEPINISDTGILSRNLWFSQRTAVVLFFLFNRKAKFVDYAGGYGVLPRLMRDIGFDFYWHDPFAKNLFARGFEYNQDLGEIELITSFESFEHFSNPLKDIDKMLSISQNILFSTELLPQPIPKPEDWWYYGLDHGQHLSFYSLQTLNHIAKNYHLNFYSNGTDMHLFSPKKINNNLFKMLLKFPRYGLFFIVRKKMKSLTSEDLLVIKSSGPKREKRNAF